MRFLMMIGGVIVALVGAFGLYFLATNLSFTGFKDKKDDPL